MTAMKNPLTLVETTGLEIAIIGMAGRFPGAKNIDEFWRNLRDGKESITFFSDEDLRSAGVDPSLLGDSKYVRAAAVLDGVDSFDAAFFDCNPREAELLDPQHRLFLETAWEALEDAGYNTEAYKGALGVYAGASKSNYGHSLSSDSQWADAGGAYQLNISTGGDFLPTRVSYKLNLQGPSINVQTACSTSLVAVHLACQGLLNGECDMVLAGGVSVSFPRRLGYRYQEGMILSPDGHCRAFDAKSQGTVGGEGVGVVVLKRLADAIADRDSVHAIIKGSAINNDGCQKVGYTAPSVEGQAKVIRAAQVMANVEPESVSYIEAHGTGTELGDPVEVAALTKAFQSRTPNKGFCAIGSVKTNIGHLDVAAGVAGLIKTVLALKHKLLPANLHFVAPNPKIDFENSPFYVNHRLSEWQLGTTPRRAGVSSFGIGGTNAHVVLEEAPVAETSLRPRGRHLLLLSAKTERTLEHSTKNLARYLKDDSEANLADVAYTLQTGRRSFDYRRALICDDVEEAVNALESLDPKRVITKHNRLQDAPVVFMFPGQGSQYVNMGARLYEENTVFRGVVDDCSDVLASELDIDLRTFLFPRPCATNSAEKSLTETFLTQPALFVIEYALAQLWLSWGIRPHAVVGHSLGEYVAACVGGVMTRDDALRLVAARARLMQDLPGGAMLAVRMPAAKLEPLLCSGISLAAENATSNTVVSGPYDAIQILRGQLTEAGAACRLLKTSHAFHSQMMDPILESFGELARKVNFSASRVPWVSSLTGDWITTAQAIDASYWTRQLREPVRFAQAIKKLVQDSEKILLEVGPGTALATFVKQGRDKTATKSVLTSIHQGEDGNGEMDSMFQSLGQLWLAGKSIDWQRVHGDNCRRRLHLPTYPFERKRFCMDALAGRVAEAKNVSAAIETVTVDSSEPANQLNQQGDPITVASSLGELNPADLKADVLVRLQALFADLSGLESSSLDVSASHMELGFDSLFLTQTSAAIEKTFGTKVTFRQLLEELTTLDALADYLAPSLAELQQPAKTATTLLASLDLKPTGSAGISTIPTISNNGCHDAGLENLRGPDAGTLERIFAKQLELMSRQLDMLQNQRTEHENADVETASSRREELKPYSMLSGRPRPHADHATTHTVAVVNPSFSQESKGFGPYKQIATDDAGALTAPQRENLDAFIARYTARTRESKRLTAEHRAHLADPRTVAGFRRLWKEIVYPIVTARSTGSKLWDVDGNEYIDLTNGFGAILFGHAPKFVTSAIEAQLKQGMELGPQSPLAGKVARLLCELTGTERAGFCNTGSEAVLAAIRVARTVTGRDKVAMFTGGYHGIFDEVVARSVGANGNLRSLPAAPGIPTSMAENIIVLDYDSSSSLEILHTRAPEIAAIIVEPVQSRRLALQPREFLHELRRLTAQTGIALIFDEIVSGFRAHLGGAQALFSVVADIATYGKVIGGGLPIGVVAGKARFMDALDGGQWNYGDDTAPEVGMTFFAGTFVRHPLALAAAWACLNHLKEQGPQLQEQLNQRTERLVDTLRIHAKQVDLPVRITHFSSLFSLEFPTDLPCASLFYAYMREKGIHLWEGRLGILTTAHTDEDLHRIVEAFKHSVAEMQEAGFFPVSGAKTSSQPIDVAKSTGRFNLTEAQRELWLAAQMGNHASAAFVDSVTLSLRGRLQPEALTKAVNEVVARHDSLRSTFSDNGLERLVTAELVLDITFIDLSGLEQREKTARLTAFIADERGKIFDLRRGPLLRSRLIKLAEDDHVLCLTTHHLAVDGWSLGVLLSELGVIYSTVCKGEPPRLPAAVQFSDYVRWEEGRRQSGDSAASEAYWLEKFKEPVPILDLPLDRPRPAEKTYDAAREQLVLPSYLCKELRQLAGRRGATMFSTLLAVFNVLVHRLTGQEDIVIGIPAAGQMAFGGHDLVGHCVNFLPLRGLITDTVSFEDYLAATKSSVLDAYDHQHSTYASLLQKLTLPRDPGRLPLMSVSFNLDRDRGISDFDGLTVEALDQPRVAINFDSEINIVESDNGIKINWHYNVDLFHSETVQRWLRHFQTLVAAIVANSAQSISELPLLTDDERHQLLVRWNDTAVPFSTDYAVHKLFEMQVERVPKSTALEFEGKRLTYRELNARANQVAHHLTHLGIGSDSLVGVCIERSIEMVTALLAVLKSGAGYVPLDPAYPDERLDFMLGDANVAVLLTQERLRSRFEDQASDLWRRKTPIKIVSIDAQEQGIAQADTQNPLSDSVPENLAYVIYTSGSTGSPKGVEITHRSLVNFLSSMRDQLPFTERETLLAVTTISFDIAGLEIYLPLIVGAKVVLVSREDAADGTKLLNRLTEHSVTAMQATPTTWRLLLEAGWQGSARFKILCGGEAFAADLAESLLKRGMVWNLYGPTETTIWSMAHRVAPEEGPIPIGRPIANTEVYVLDTHLQPVPIGVAGELYIGGAGLARGYHNQFELTAAKFIRNPFTNDPSARLYRTGDLVRYQSNGAMEFIGRIDNQVKLRGFRIELAEIENTLGQYPKVREAAVLVREDRPGDKRLVAYVVQRQNHRLTIDDLKSHLKKKLPEFMVPSVFVVLESFPLTPNGKVDRKTLPVPAANRPEIIERYREPRSGMEEMLASIWAEVLNVKRVGACDNFFDLGGHSLLAIRVVQCIEKRIGRPVRMADIFRAPTVEQLSKLLDNSQPVASWSSLLPLQTKGFKAPFFWVHGEISDAYLPRYLDAEQPLYGLNHQSTDGQRALYTTVENIAAHYLEEILTVQRGGPYRLGGNCFGGLVAFEMAKQLQTRGQTVDLLMLLNPTHNKPVHSSNPSSGFLRNNVSHCHQAFQSAKHQNARWLIKGLLKLIAHATSSLIGAVKRLLQKAVCTTYLRFGFPIPVSLRSRYILDIYARATAGYTVKEYSGKIVFVFGHDYPEHLRMDWTKRSTGSVKMHEVPGDHDGVLDDINVKLWAQQLAAYL